MILLSAFSVQEASAQRTMPGRFFAGLKYSMTAFPSDLNRTQEYDFGMGQYLGDIYWYAGAEFTPISWNPDIQRSIVGIADVHGGVMYRAVCTRNRMLSLYVGGHAVAGIDFGSDNPISDTIDIKTDTQTNSIVHFNDDGTDETDYSSTVSGKEPFAPTKFTYGLTPRVELEFFPLKQFAIVADFSLHLRFQSQFSNVYGRFGIGARYNF